MQHTDLELIREVNIGAVTLLAHFHYFFRVASPFDSEGKLDNAILPYLEASERELIEFIKAAVPEGGLNYVLHLTIIENY